MRNWHPLAHKDGEGARKHGRKARRAAGRPLFEDEMQQEEMWKMLGSVPSGCKVKDGLAVAVVIRDMRRARSAKELEEVGRSIKGRFLGCDLDTLRQVYLQLRRGIQ